MATIKWKGGNYHIVKFEVGDRFTDGKTFIKKSSCVEYRLIYGAWEVRKIHHDWSDVNDIHDVIRVKGEDIDVLTEKNPDPVCWWKLISESMNYSDDSPYLSEIDLAVDYEKPSFMDTIAYTPKDLIITCLGVAAAMFGIMR